MNLSKNSMTEAYLKNKITVHHQHMWRLVVCFPEKVEVFAFLSLLAPTASVTGHREMPPLMCFLWPAQEVFFYPRKSRISNTFIKIFVLSFFQKEFKRWQSPFPLVLSLLWQLGVWLDNIGDVWLFSENMNWCWKQMRYLIQLPSTASKLFVFVRGAPKHCRTTILCDFQKIFFTKRKKSF